MFVHRLMELVDIEDGIKVCIRWPGFLETKNTLGNLVEILFG